LNVKREKTGKLEKFFAKLNSSDWCALYWGDSV